MARIFTDSFEIASGLWPNSAAAAYSSIALQALSGFTQPGAMVVKVRETENTSRYAYFRNDTALASKSEVYGRMYVQPVDDEQDGGFNRSILWISNVATVGVANEQVSIFYNTDRTISICVGGTKVCTSLTALAIGTRYLIEFHFKVHSTSGEVELKINGTTEGTWSGNTNPKSTGVLGYLWIGANSGTAVGYSGYQQINIDCVAFNDTEGSSDNSWCGASNLTGSGRLVDGPVDLISAGYSVGNTSSIKFSDGIECSLNTISFNAALIRNQALIQSISFKTHETPQGFTDLGNYINSLEAGDLLIIVVKDQAYDATQSETYTTAMANRMKSSLYGSIANGGSYAIASFVDVECLFEEVGAYKIEESVEITWPGGETSPVRRFAQII